MLQPGDTAPAFTLPDQDGNEVSLADLPRPLVVYFYPKANTSGCTTQACGVRDHRGDYEAAGATVVGISPDPVKDVKKFHDAQGLNFTLLADEDHAVCEAFGTWQEKSMYGRTYWGATRSTFVIGEGDEITGVIVKAQPKTHDEKVLKLLAG
jgi:thioredoxin-dependent peroxiredoxin